MRKILIVTAIAVSLTSITAPVGAVEGPRPFADPQDAGNQKQPVKTDVVLPEFIDPPPGINAAGDEFDGDPK